MDAELKKILKREASAHHMCEENRALLPQLDAVEDAISLYKKNINWALEECYPDIDVIRKYFSDVENLGIYIDKQFNGESLIEHPVYVFHNCTGTIRTGLNVDKKIIPMLYFANGCDMTVKSSDTMHLSSRVPLHVFGDNIISVEKSEDIECVIYKFDTK